MPSWRRNTANEGEGGGPKKKRDLKTEYGWEGVRIGARTKGKGERGGKGKLLTETRNHRGTPIDFKKKSFLKKKRCRNYSHRGPSHKATERGPRAKGRGGIFEKGKS